MAEVTDRWLVAAAYEGYMGRWSRAVASAFVEWLEVPLRSHWLDVGCGTGALTAAICQHKRPASVLACDPSGPLIEYASSILPERSVSFELAEADHLPRREGGFDAVVSGLVLNFVPDAARAVAAMRSRLSPSGLVAAYVWDYAGGMELLGQFWDAAAELDPAAQPLMEAQRFASCSEATLSSLFQSAGLAGVSTRALEIDTRFRSFDELWQPFLGRTGPAPSYVASLPAAAREQLRERLRQRVPSQSDGSISLRARAWAVRGQAALPA